MKDKYKKLFLICFIAVFFVLFFSIKPASALEVPEYPEFFGKTITSDSTLPDYIAYFFNFGMAIAGLLAVIVIAWGGILWMFGLSIGKIIDPQKGTRAPAEAKEWIKAGVIGLVILLSAYLIVYTINPDLIYLRLKPLIPTYLQKFLGKPTIDEDLFSATYQEIPLGILTENLLTRTMDCYDFDGNGDFIEGEKITTDDGRTLFGPTYLEHDRADCFLKLSEAIEKKSDIANELAKKIAELMTQCKCSSGQSVCWSKDQKDKIKIGRIAQDSCEPTLKQSDCAALKSSAAACQSMQKPCESKGGLKEDCEKCPPEIVKKREEGPIKLDDGTVAKGGKEDSPEVCSDKEYQGLNEFRSKFNNNYFAIKNVVEIQPPAQLDGKEISIINNGNCPVCDYKCPTGCDANDRKCQEEKQKCEAERAKCQEERKKCLKENSPWHSLRLIDQLTYLKGKAEEIKQKVQHDLDELNKARKKISDCYTIKSSVDFLEIKEETKKVDKTIKIQKIFNDAETQKGIDPSKYCSGFNYAGSDCYSACQDICPGSNKDDLKNYKNCPNCNDKKDDEKQKCLEEQTECMKEQFFKRDCPNSPFENFEKCMETCQKDCSSRCQIIYSDCPADLKECQDKCNNDSKCLLENEEKCIVNFRQLRQCADDYNGSKDEDKFKKCADDSFSCKYCSDQYAGYPGCLEYGYRGKNPDGSRNEYIAEIEYSSSFLCKYPDYQLCPNPYEKVEYTYKDEQGEEKQGKTSGNCVTVYPETAKCPLVSKCPECPCNISGPDLNPETMDVSCSQANNDKNNEYRVCSVNCGEYTYSGDPLTFYCRTSFEPEEKLSGRWFTCSKAEEIPVGQAVDDAKKWGEDFLKAATTLTETANNMVNYLKKVGQQTNYCQCDSICGCHSKCIYLPPIYEYDLEGNIIGIIREEQCNAQKSCPGNPCQKMINLLLGEEKGNELTNTDNEFGTCPSEGVEWYLEQIKDSLEKVKEFILKDKRSDILKELEYSRKKMNDCSQDVVEFGKDVFKTINCTRAYKAGLCSNLGTRCYGVLEGQTRGEDLMDNWFCAKALLK